MESAARHKLMVELHGAFVPRGLARTYPNFVTQEGVLGSEYNKWSRRVTAGHNVMLAFTRGMLGPTDYIPAIHQRLAGRVRAPLGAADGPDDPRAQSVDVRRLRKPLDQPCRQSGHLPREPRRVRLHPRSADQLGRDTLRRRRCRPNTSSSPSAKANLVPGRDERRSASKATVPLSFLGRGNWSADLWLDGRHPTRSAGTHGTSPPVTLSMWTWRRRAARWPCSNVARGW